MEIQAALRLVDPVLLRLAALRACFDSAWRETVLVGSFLRAASLARERREDGFLFGLVCPLL